MSSRSTSELLPECTCDPVPDYAGADSVPAEASPMWRLLEQSPRGNVTQPSLTSIFGGRLHILCFSIKKKKGGGGGGGGNTDQSHVMSKQILFQFAGRRWRRQMLESIQRFTPAPPYSTSSSTSSTSYTSSRRLLHILHLYHGPQIFQFCIMKGASSNTCSTAYF